MTTLALQQFAPRVGRRGPSAGASVIAGASIIAAQQLERWALIGQVVLQSALGEELWGSPAARLMEGFEESLKLSQHTDIRAPTDEALREALALISSLPTWAPPPTPIMEHDGAIAFEWDVGEGRFFVVAVDGTGRAEYSAILGVDGERSGTANFTGTLPLDAEVLLASLLPA